nr:protein kinase/lanthionine synthetase C family protein [Amycolatopsis jejuensis]
MEVRHEIFRADPRFPDRRPELPAGDLTGVLPPPGPMWTVEHQGEWRLLRPVGEELPEQGWQVQISAAANAIPVLQRVHEHCVEHRITHRHLRSTAILLDHNAEFPTRAGNGALAIIYPADNNTLEQLLGTLSTLLRGEPGPDIPGTIRYGECPIHVHYGGFLEQWTDHAGTRVPAIRRPSGALEPEQQEAVPDWLRIPHYLAAHAGEPQPPHPVTDVLARARGRAVHLAERGGTPVVIEEAWPHTGFDAAGTDAATRLQRKREILDRLAGIPGIPQVHTYLPGRRHYLVREYLPGLPLDDWLARHYPLTRRDCPEADLAAYRKRAQSVVAQVDRIVAEARQRGVVLENPRNILVDESDTVSLTGFESSKTLLPLKIFLPLAPLFDLVPEKMRWAAELTERRFSLPTGYADGIAPRSEPAVPTELDAPRPHWSLVRKQITEALLASATPERTDQLFPGEGAGFGTGAAGVLHSLHIAGAGRYPEHEQWLLDAVRRDPPKQPGFFHGSHGIAYVLEEFGHRKAADELLASSRSLVDQTTGHDLASGLAGIGLTRLYFATSRGGNEFGRQALGTGVRLADALDTAAPPGRSARAGLLHGWSGPALLFLRLHERTGEPVWLEFADQALERDLEECLPAPDGSLPVRDGDRGPLRTAGVGSAGILMVAEQLARHRPEARSCRSLPGLRVACRGEFALHPGLLNGRCGLAAALAFANQPTQPTQPHHQGQPTQPHHQGQPTQPHHQGQPNQPDRRTRDAIERHLTRLSWHAVPFHGGLAFPGSDLRHLSADVATGGAGVLRTLSALLDGTELLPFLGPVPPIA